MRLALIVLLSTYTLFSQELKVMSYNLRVDFGGDGDNNWEFRRDLLAAQVASYSPDFIGTQEGRFHQLEFINQALPEHTFIGVSRDGSSTEGEFSAIFYNQNKFRLIDQLTFWLSETPEKKSKGWDAAYERICTYGLFEDRASKRRFYVFNTHLDHVGESARNKGIELILKKIKSTNYKNLPVIFTGDFNTEPGSQAYRLLTDELIDAQSASQTPPLGPSGTFNGFQSDRPVTQRIDYIFVSSGISVLKYCVLSDLNDGKYPSDHLPVYAEVHLR